MEMLKWADKLATIEFAKLGKGPRHPENPVLDSREPLDSFVRAHPFIPKYPDYLEFLKQFGAAGIYHPDYKSNDYTFVSILGFDSEAGGDLIEDGVTLVDENGFLVFCEAETRTKTSSENGSIDDGIVNLGFALDATGARAPCIYASRYKPAVQAFGEFAPFCDSFTTWLSELVQCKGRFTL